MLTAAPNFQDYVFAGTVPFARVNTVDLDLCNTRWHRKKEAFYERIGEQIRYVRQGVITDPEPQRLLWCYIRFPRETEISVGADQSISGYLFISCRHWLRAGFLDNLAPHRGDTFTTSFYEGYVDHVAPINRNGEPVHYKMKWEGTPISRVPL